MARRSMEIALSVRGASRVSTQFKNTATAADDAADAYDRQQASLERLTRAMEDAGRVRSSLGSGGAVAPFGGGSGGGGVGSRQPTGPLARYLSAQAAFEANPDDFDTIYRYNRAQKALDRAEKSLQPRDPWAEMLQTSRLNLGPISPLVNRLEGIHPGIGMGLGAAGLAVSGYQVAERAARELGRQLGEAAASARDFAAARTVSGGTTQDIARLTSMGISPGQIGGIAGGLRERLSSDPEALMAASRLGLGFQAPRMFGQQNEAKVLNDTLEALRRVTDAEEQLRLARMLGVDSMLDQIRVSDRTWRAMRRDSLVREQLFDPRTQQAARDLTAEVGRIERALENLRLGALKGVLPDAAGAANRTANAINGGALLAEAAVKQIGPFLANFLPVGGAMDGFLQTLERLGQMGGDDPSAVDQNTDAMRELTKVLKEGVYGGDNRAANAIPRAYRGFALDQAVAGGGWRLGAFV